MDRKYLPLLAFFILLITATPLESGLRIQNSDWNTNISTTSILEIIVWVLIAFMSFLYWKLSKNSKEINLRLFLFYFLLAIPMVLYARLNLPIRQLAAKNSNDILELITIRNTILYSVLSMFCIGQIIFIFLLFKMQNKNI
jgi:hypothetical protein